jgi:hypothetical protein
LFPRKLNDTFDTPPETADIDLTEAMVEREPLTVVVTEKGWIRALKGHQQDLSSLQFKGDDGLKFSFFTETTAKLLMMMTDGKVFTLDASKLPGGRGFGDPIRLMVDLVLMMDTELSGGNGITRTVNDCCCGTGGILTIAKGTLPLALFGPDGYGLQQGWLGVGARTLQACAPWTFGTAQLMRNLAKRKLI